MGFVLHQKYVRDTANGALYKGVGGVAPRGEGRRCCFRTNPRGHAFPSYPKRMKTVAYASPHVPIEWIAAHGVRPVRLNPRVEGEASPLALRRGVCPFAGAVLDVVVAGVDACAVIFTTACDQMRYACAAAEPSTRVPLFLLNVPSTWQTPTAGRLFREEVERLGRFLVELGGTTPADEELADVMLRFERERATARATYVRHSSLTSLFGQAGKPDVPWSPGFGRLKPVLQQESQAGPDVDWGRAAVPLALVGGPLLDNDREIFSIVEGAGEALCSMRPNKASE